MKRLNEYSKDELQVLQIVLATAYHDFTKNHPEIEPTGILTWSADVREALHDIEIEEASLPFPNYKVLPL